MKMATSNKECKKHNWINCALCKYPESIPISNKDRYAELERQVIELLSVSGCKNVVEVIDKFKKQ